MSKLKDKLSANMRMAKENHPQTPAKTAPQQSPTPAVTHHAADKQAAEKNAQSPVVKTVPGDVPDSGSKLFPDRVWPD